MRKIMLAVLDFFRKGDLILLLLCLGTTGFGTVIVASTTNSYGSTRYVIIQLAAAAIGVGLFILFSSIDLDTFSENRQLLVAFNVLLLLMLIPFGTDNGTGNRSWLDFPLMPIDIQPAEICKITFILIMASVMSAHQNRISSIPSITHMVFHLGLLVGLNMILSRDAGVSLIFVFIFIGMAFAGGVSLGWFGLGGGMIAAAAPIVWNHFMGQYQKNRILILFDDSIDPMGINERFHTRQSLMSLTGGGLTGQGLFHGRRTQTDALFAKHTDYIFSSIGEELGFVGCLVVLILLFAIVGRCIYVGIRTPDYMRRLVCFGTATALIFQVCSNVGMCIGVTPVIGLTLPFISYGGSSLVSLFAMLGLVSGAYARPMPTAHEIYIQPPR